MTVETRVRDARFKKVPLTKLHEIGAVKALWDSEICEFWPANDERRTLGWPPVTPHLFDNPNPLQNDLFIEF